MQKTRAYPFLPHAKNYSSVCIKNIYPNPTRNAKSLFWKASSPVSKITMTRNCF